MHLATLPKIEATQEAGRIGINHLEAKEKAKASKEKEIPHGGHQEIHQEVAAKARAKARKAKVRAKARKAQVGLLQAQPVHGTHREVVKLSCVSSI